MNKVIARLTVIRTNGRRVIVEVNSDASFHQFYKFYVQDGRRHSTKRQVRTASRNEGLNIINAHLQQPGLDVIAKMISRFQQTSNPVVSSTVRILRKRAYRKLTTAAADTLGMTRLTTTDLNGPRGIPVGRQSFRIVSKVNHSKLHRGLVGVS